MTNLIFALSLLGGIAAGAFVAMALFRQHPLARLVTSQGHTLLHSGRFHEWNYLRCSLPDWRPNLSNQKFKRDLININFRQAEVSCAEFRVIRSCDFRDAMIWGAHFLDTAENTRFDGADLSDAVFEKYLVTCSLRHANTERMQVAGQLFRTQSVGSDISMESVAQAVSKTSFSDAMNELSPVQFEQLICNILKSKSGKVVNELREQLRYGIDFAVQWDAADPIRLFRRKESDAITDTGDSVRTIVAVVCKKIAKASTVDTPIIEELVTGPLEYFRKTHDIAHKYVLIAVSSRVSSFAREFAQKWPELIIWECSHIQDEFEALNYS